MRGNRWVLAAALALIVVGVVGVLSWSNDDTSDRQAARVASTTSTSQRTEVLGVVIDNTTTTVPAGPTTSVATGAKATTTTVAKVGRVWGYSYQTQGDDQTTVELSQGDKVVVQAKTDGNGYYEFTNVAPGTYTLSRTTSSGVHCATTTTAGEKPACASARSSSVGPEFTLSPGGEVRADVF